MLKKIVVLLLCGLTFSLFAVEGDSLSVNRENIPENAAIPMIDYVESQLLNDSLEVFYVNNYQIYEQAWDELAHPSFWKYVMQLSPDSCVINVGQTRHIIESLTVKEWEQKSSAGKSAYRDSVRKAMELDSDTKIFMTTGKRDFYNFDNILETISKGVAIFKDENVDPWYAQSILMIESPGRLARSIAGAYGSFQLMPDVARKFGLKVNKYVDERKDFDKSAFAASQLIQKVCISEAQKMLDEKCISYQETDLWFRLFVLHIYHAGALNVKGVFNKINPEEGGMDLIQKMWVTKNGKFGNASQNYSQVALAVMMIFDDLLWGC